MANVAQEEPKILQDQHSASSGGVPYCERSQIRKLKTYCFNEAFSFYYF